MRVLGPTFGDELTAAGLGGLPLVWFADGTISGRERLTPDQAAALDAVIAAHDAARVPAPALVDLWKARTVMSTTPWAGTYGGAGRTVLDAVEAAIADLPDVARRTAATEALEYANTLTRRGSLVGTIQHALGMSDAQLDALFAQAAAIPT